MDFFSKSSGVFSQISTGTPWLLSSTASGGTAYLRFSAAPHGVDSRWSFEPRKDRLAFIESWLVNRDPYNGL